MQRLLMEAVPLSSSITLAQMPMTLFPASFPRNNHITIAESALIYLCSAGGDKVPLCVPAILPIGKARPS